MARVDKQQIRVEDVIDDIIDHGTITSKGMLVFVPTKGGKNPDVEKRELFGAIDEIRAQLGAMLSPRGASTMAC